MSSGLESSRQRTPPSLFRAQAWPPGTMPTSGFGEMLQTRCRPVNHGERERIAGGDENAAVGKTEEKESDERQAEGRRHGEGDVNTGADPGEIRTRRMK